MVTMTDIAQFLAARLDEDEAAAVRAARPEPWVKPQPSRPDWYVQFWADGQDRAAVIADPESSAYPIVATLGYDGNDEADEELAEGRVEHIARHDPARVLAEVAAKRERLRMYIEQRGMLEAIHANPEQHSHDQLIAAAVSTGVLKAMVQIDVAVYADHPDYDPAWRVQ